MVGPRLSVSNCTTTVVDSEDVAYGEPGKHQMFIADACAGPSPRMCCRMMLHVILPSLPGVELNLGPMA